MQFRDFLLILYENSHQPGQEQYVMEIFSALCGEKNPLKTNRAKEITKNHDIIENFAYSVKLPEGLTGEDPAYKKNLYGGPKYKGLSGSIKKHIQRYKNKDTFIKYLDETTSSNNFLELCEDFDIPCFYDRIVIFESIYRLFLEFTISPNDEVGYSLFYFIEKVLENKNDNKTGVNKTTEDHLIKKSENVRMFPTAEKFIKDIQKQHQPLRGKDAIIMPDIIKKK